MNAKPHDVLAEIGRLLILAQIARQQKKTVTNGSASETSPKVTVSQRRPEKASVTLDSNRVGE